MYCTWESIDTEDDDDDDDDDGDDDEHTLNLSYYLKRKARGEGQTAFFKERTQLASVRTKPTLFLLWVSFSRRYFISQKRLNSVGRGAGGPLPYIPVFGKEWTKRRSPIFRHSVFGPKPFQSQEQPDKNELVTKAPILD